MFARVLSGSAFGERVELDSFADVEAADARRSEQPLMAGKSHHVGPKFLDIHGDHARRLGRIHQEQGSIAVGQFAKLLGGQNVARHVAGHRRREDLDVARLELVLDKVQIDRIIGRIRGDLKTSPVFSSRLANRSRNGVVLEPAHQRHVTGMPIQSQDRQGSMSRSPKA